MRLPVSLLAQLPFYVPLSPEDFSVVAEMVRIIDAGGGIPGGACPVRIRHGEVIDGRKRIVALVSLSKFDRELDVVDTRDECDKQDKAYYVTIAEELRIVNAQKSKTIQKLKRRLAERTDVKGGKPGLWAGILKPTGEVEDRDHRVKVVMLKPGEQLIGPSMGLPPE